MLPICLRLARAETALAAEAFDDAEAWLGHTARLGIDSPDIHRFRAALESERIRAESQRVISVSELELVSYAPPSFPLLAARRNVEGWVDVQFVVARDGSTRDIEIVAAERTGYFEDASREAVAQWRFKPREFRGQIIEQKVRVRLTFKYQ